MNMQQIPLLVYTNSKYHDVLSIFLKQIVIHCQQENFEMIPEIYILSDSDPLGLTLENSLFRESEPSIQQAVRWVKYSDHEPYWSHIFTALSTRDMRKYPYVLFMQDDFWINGKFNFASLLPLIRIFDEIKGLSFIRLLASGCDIFSYKNPHKFERSLINFNRDFYFVHPLCSHPYSMQATIWRRQDFLNFIFVARRDLVWQEPDVAYGLAMVRLGILGIASKKSKIPYVATAVEKGYWNLSPAMQQAYHLMGLESVKDILERHAVDPNIRGWR